MADVFVSLREPFGKLIAGVNYKVVRQGYDFVEVKGLGKVFCVPKNLITSPVVEVVEEELAEEDEYESAMEDYNKLFSNKKR